MKKRNSLTLPRKGFYDKITCLKPEVRHLVVDKIFELLFDNIAINYDELPETAAIALACIVPDLRTVQSKYENGISLKKKLK